MKTGTCHDCGWWDGPRDSRMVFSDDMNWVGPWGYCRRNLPVITERSPHRWPPTKSNDWCGFWQCEDMVDVWFRETTGCGGEHGER